MKLTREQVNEIVRQEGEFAKRYDCQVSYPPRHICDADKPLEQWLLWMEQYVQDARKYATSGYDYDKALDCLRSALSLGANCAMYHGLPERKVNEQGS
jgi:hypothetical protein